MKFSKGSLVVGEWHGAPVRIHWTVILCAAFFSRFQFLPVFWVSFFLLVLVHEFGHALMIRRFRLTVEEIVVLGFGGYCRWYGYTTSFRRSVIAWGGVLAQLIVLLIACLARLISGPATNFYANQMYHVCISTNVLMIIFNLMPIRPLDGSEAWRIIGPIREEVSEKVNARLKERKFRRQDEAIQKELKKIMEISPDSEIRKK